MTDTDSWTTEEGDEITPTENTEPAESPTDLELPADFDGIEILGFVEEIPPQAGSIYAEIVGALLDREDKEDGWMTITTGNRQPQTVQTGLLNAARALGVEIRTKRKRKKGDDEPNIVYFRLADKKADKKAKGKGDK